MSRIRQLWVLAVLAIPREFSVQAEPPVQSPEAVVRGEAAQDGATGTGARTRELDAVKAGTGPVGTVRRAAPNADDQQRSHPPREALANGGPGTSPAAVGDTANLFESDGRDWSEQNARGCASASGSDEFQRHERATGAGREPVATIGRAAKLARDTAGRRSVDQFAGRALRRADEQPRSRDPAAGQRPGSLGRGRRGRSTFSNRTQPDSLD